MATEELGEEVIEAEGEETPAQPPLDIDALVAEAEARIVKMKENKPNKNVEATFSGWVVALNEASDAALSDAIRAEAAKRKEHIDAHSESEKYKNKMLAVKVCNGEYDA